MKTGTIYYSLFLLTLFSFLSCSTVTKLTPVPTFENVEKPNETIGCISKVPVIEPAPETKQMQTKGSVTISAEIVNFTSQRNVKTTTSIAPTYDREFDVYEYRNEPNYIIAPYNVEFKIRIKNNQDRILKLSDAAIVFQVDGNQVSVDSRNYTSWKNAMIVPGQEKEISVFGPSVSSLPESGLIGLFFYDVPVEHDGAGIVKKKENYSWYFGFKIKEEKIQEEISYEYKKEPVYKEMCRVCRGTSSIETFASCASCRGTGSMKTSKGSTYRCTSCAGSGRRAARVACGHCVRGSIYHPKSSMVRTSDTWLGWKVKVAVTSIEKSSVFVVEPNSNGEYKYIGGNDVTVNWYYSSNKKYPIIISIKGQEIKVLPYEGEKPSKLVEVNFTNGTPTVLGGRIVTE